MGHRPKRFLIWGAGGHGRVVADVVRDSGNELLGFVDKEPATHDFKVYLESDLIERIHRSGGYPDEFEAVALGIGNNHQRVAKMRALSGLEFPALVHPSASVSATALLGRGTVVMPHAVINAGARISEGSIINSGSIVEHDCELGVGVHISPGATVCGGVRIGELSWICAGATIIHGLKLGSQVVVGAGSTVLEDVPSGSIVVGSPARPVSNAV